MSKRISGSQEHRSAGGLGLEHEPCCAGQDAWTCSQREWELLEGFKQWRGMKALLLP